MERKPHEVTESPAAAGKPDSARETEKLFAEDLIFTVNAGVGTGAGHEVATLFRRRLGHISPSDVVE